MPFIPCWSLQGPVSADGLRREKLVTLGTTPVNTFSGRRIRLVGVESDSQLHCKYLSSSKVIQLFVLRILNSSLLPDCPKAKARVDYVLNWDLGTFYRNGHFSEFSEISKHSCNLKKCGNRSGRSETRFQAKS